MAALALAPTCHLRGSRVRCDDRAGLALRIMAMNRRRTAPPPPPSGHQLGVRRLALDGQAGTPALPVAPSRPRRPPLRTPDLPGPPPVAPSPGRRFSGRASPTAGLARVPAPSSRTSGTSLGVTAGAARHLRRRLLAPLRRGPPSGPPLAPGPGPKGPARCGHWTLLAGMADPYRRIRNPRRKEITSCDARSSMCLSVSQGHWSW